MHSQTLSTNKLVDGYVPKNVTKYPIEETYSTAKALRSNGNMWQFKCPEVWSSARSGKKSIAIRSITWVSKREHVRFKLIVRDFGGTNEHSVLFDKIVPALNSIMDIIGSIVEWFNAWVTANKFDYTLSLNYVDNSLTMSIGSASKTKTYEFRIVDINSSGESESIKTPSESFNKLFNQRLDMIRPFSSSTTYENVWDRETLLHFHASFIPFDSYQYLGVLYDTWQKPVVYQDPNTSPIFNVWTTTDLKKTIPILHEIFIFRFTFIISTDQNYA